MRFKVTIFNLVYLRFSLHQITKVIYLIDSSVVCRIPRHTECCNTECI